MKRNAHGNSILTALITCTVLGTVLAQLPTGSESSPTRRPAPKGEGQRAMRPMGAPGGFGQLGTGLARLLEVLTDEQRASLRQALQEQRAKAGDLDQRLRTARQEVFAASVAEKFDEDAVRQKAEALAKLEAELTVLRARAFSQMRPRLTPEQIERINNPGPSGRDSGQLTPPRRHPQTPHDENGLPPKDAPLELHPTPR
jgi:Spy/CpxP family protein refolding chaperone